jgi:hypothetical protein
MNQVQLISALILFVLLFFHDRCADYRVVSLKNFLVDRRLRADSPSLTLNHVKNVLLILVSLTISLTNSSLHDSYRIIGWGDL